MCSKMLEVVFVGLPDADEFPAIQEQNLRILRETLQLISLNRRLDLDIFPPFQRRDYR